MCPIFEHCTIPLFALLGFFAASFGAMHLSLAYRRLHDAFEGDPPEPSGIESGFALAHAAALLAMIAGLAWFVLERVQVRWVDPAAASARPVIPPPPGPFMH